MDSDSQAEIMLNLSLLCKNSFDALKAGEILARAATSLALEGMAVNLNITQIEPDPEGVEEEK